MHPRTLRRNLVTACAVASAIVVAACAEDIHLGSVAPESAAVPAFTPQDGGEPLDAGPLLLACMGTTCPAPFATCVSEDGPTYKCGVDLSRDLAHCGACNSACPTYKPIHMSSRCVDGSCELECLSEPDPFNPVDWRNCNGIVDDGCEVNVLKDTDHCGACGNVCAPGTQCIDGKCGCPAGKIPCFGRCVDPQKDDNNCGGCGVVCEPPAGACDPMPSGAYYGCKDGACGTLKCQDRAADCNGDLTSASCAGDGCEVTDLATDRDNCGACGNACQGDEECVNEGNGPECAVPCTRFGLSACPGLTCKDLLNDVTACGACGAVCPGAGPNQSRTCKKGLCGFECNAGFADCNGDPGDGCETNLRVHPGNCGACGVTCDVGAGQPCVEGSCLMTTCDAGATR